MVEAKLAAWPHTGNISGQNFARLMACYLAEGVNVEWGGKPGFANSLPKPKVTVKPKKTVGLKRKATTVSGSSSTTTKPRPKARCKRCGCALCKAAQKQVGKENAKCAASKSEVNLFSVSGSRGQAPLEPSKSKLKACVRSCCGATACWHSQFGGGGGGSKDETTPDVAVAVPAPAPVLSVLMGK